MPYNKLNISGAEAEVLAWVDHDLSLDEPKMLRDVSRLPCVFKHVSMMPDGLRGVGRKNEPVEAMQNAIIAMT
jgi:hypothetical protein